MEEIILEVKMIDDGDTIEFTFNNIANSKAGKKYCTEIMKAMAVCLNKDNLEYAKMQTDKGEVNLLQ